jgi:hypothetical protein
MPTLTSLVNSVIISLSLLAPGSIVVLGQGQNQAQGQSEIASINVFIVSSTTAKTHQLDLKGIEGESPTRNLVIRPESVVQVNQSDNLVVFTQPINQVIESVKVQDANGVVTTLPPLGNNAFSLAGLPTGAYILDVIVDLGSGKRGAYETILVVLQQGQQPVQPAQVINRVQISDDISIIFNGDNGNDTGNNGNQTDPDPPPPGNETEPIICTMEISYGQGPCDEYYIPPDENGQCPEGHRFVDERTGCVPDEFVSPPCSIDDQGNEVCPLTDEITPVPEPPPPCPPETRENGVCPLTDEITPVPEPPPPDCPEAGPELCGEEPPPEDGPDSGRDGSDNDNAGGNGDGDGEDGSSGNGDNGGDSNDNNGETFGGDSFFN